MMDNLIAALNATGYKFAHWGWVKDAKERERDHGVYAEDGAQECWSDNHMESQTTEGTVDYFTRDTSGTPRAVIEAALNGIESCSWYLNSVQLEADTGFIHYEWVFEVV